MTDMTEHCRRLAHERIALARRARERGRPGESARWLTLAGWARVGLRDLKRRTH